MSALDDLLSLYDDDEDADLAIEARAELAALRADLEAAQERIAGLEAELQKQTS